jgi:hypothetical protein
MDTASLIANVLRLIDKAPELTTDDVDALLARFPDLDGLTVEQRSDLAITVELEIFRGHSDGTMGTSQVLSRAQVASLAVRLQDVIFDLAE